MTYEFLLTHVAIQALGWSLLHFLWQGTLLAILLWTANALAVQSRASRSSARIRYAAACVVMLLMVGALFATFISNYPSKNPSYIAAPARNPESGVLSPGTLPPSIAATGPAIGLTGWFVSIWLVG